MEMKKIQRYLWIACIVLSIICMIFAGWACYVLSDLTCGIMVVIFAVAAFWGYQRIK